MKKAAEDNVISFTYKRKLCRNI